MNLDLPSAVVERLRTLAMSAGKPVTLYARDLLVAALARAEAPEVRRRLTASRTPARRKRDREIALGLERLRR